jgi:hypothetical protein
MVELTDISLSREETEALLTEELAAKAVRRGRPRGSPNKPKFFKVDGPFYPPVRVVWAETAGRLPGKAFQVAMILWRKSTLLGCGAVRLTSDDLIAMGIDRGAKRNALSALESAGLISVNRRNGASPVITLIPGGGLDLEDIEWERA